jgi:hypothetical protein
VDPKFVFQKVRCAVAMIATDEFDRSAASGERARQGPATDEVSGSNESRGVGANNDPHSQTLVDLKQDSTLPRGM